ncbi:MAG: Na+/H+ antiporter NhaA [Actinobacteria bacterium]|nr:Na+/H+ antiporter NhaA [Actinomycetota bacterium]
MEEEREEEREKQDEGIRMPWARSEGRVPRVLGRFLSTELSGGGLLLGAAVTALVWANLGGSYEQFWTQTLSVRLGSASLSMDLRHWVADGLMAIFFYVVGLEIKRELTTGEFRNPRTAALPVAAAVGGMVVPALVYLAFNSGGEGSHGWGIPMATDIAFALGILVVAGSALPHNLRSFLLTLAIVDDIGAIVVIAVAYSSGLDFYALGAAVVLLLVMTQLRRMRVRWVGVYAVLGVAVWVAVYVSGVHATIAGVLLGLLTPSIPFQRPAAISTEARRVADETQNDPDPPDADAEQWLRLAELSRDTVSPLARMEAALHPWSSFLIVPLFALSSAGVVLTQSAISHAINSPVTIGVVVGLLIGKPLGVVGASWIATRLKLAVLPSGVRWSQIRAVAVTAGVGFTVSLLMAELAFRRHILIEEAKIGILVGSLVAGIFGAFLLRREVRKMSGTARR